MLATMMAILTQDGDTIAFVFAFPASIAHNSEKQIRKYQRVLALLDEKQATKGGGGGGGGGNT